MQRAEEWALRVRHEASLHDANCFVTLTYGRDQLPPNGSLDHRDFQLFMKRLRKISVYGVRYYMCGEYGPQTFRPHYHACLFGADFRADRVESGRSGSGFLFYQSRVLDILWPHGRAVVQDLTPETASYCARYIMKKALGNTAEQAYQRIDVETGEVVQLKPEYAAMSLKPGIGAEWIKKNWRDVYTRDYVIADGKEHRTPRYYDKVLEQEAWPVDIDALKFAREQRARLSASDNTDERRKVREIVHQARVGTLTRSLDE